MPPSPVKSGAPVFEEVVDIRLGGHDLAGAHEDLHRLGGHRVGIEQGVVRIGPDQLLQLLATDPVQRGDRNRPFALSVVAADDPLAHGSTVLPLTFGFVCLPELGSYEPWWVPFES